MKMESTKPFYSLILLFIFISALVSLANPTRAMGINYGQIANNLPNPSDVVPLVKSLGATKVKLYDADPKVLSAFASTNIELTIGLGNEHLYRISQDPSQAQSWLSSHVLPHLPASKITAIFVGNEVLTFNDTSLSAHLLPAMENLHDALSRLSLSSQIAVTTTHSLAILEASYPPSAGKFRRDLVACLVPILEFQAKIGSPFLINAYPYFAYKSSPKEVGLDFVLFEGKEEVVDSASGLRYENMLFAQIDAVHAALDKVGFGKLQVHISETGWPSKGDPDEAGASLDNARKYNANLMKVICQKKGTPMKPNCDLNIYVFALFNENMKPGPTSERNYGLFKPDGSPVYSLGISTSPTIKNGSSSSSGSGFPVGGYGSFPSPTTGNDSSSIGYYAITSDVATRKDHLGLLPKTLALLLLLIGSLL